MMTARFEREEFERIACHLERGAIHAVATASQPEAAIADMRTALDSLEQNGHGECFWTEAAGQYRWAFRREGGKARIALLWSAGVMTGWEHVFWAEEELAETLRELRQGLERI